MQLMEDIITLDKAACERSARLGVQELLSANLANFTSIILLLGERLASGS